MEEQRIAERRKFETGARRNASKGKGRQDLWPFRAMIELSKLYEQGIDNGYPPRNWEKGIPLHEYVCSMSRHLSEMMIGKTNEAHITQMCWNALGMLDTLLRIKDGILPKSLAADLPFDEINS